MAKRTQLTCRKGQVLVLGLAMIAVIILAFLGMYRNGLLVGAKVKQTHAVDAAAYSGALIQARALNMQAYINTAQVGHQMAMAHLVTLGSWAKWASTSGRSLSVSNPPAWVIATHFGANHGQAYRQASRALTLSSIAHQHQALHQQFAKHDEIVEKVLARVSYAIRDTMEQSRDKAVAEVLRANYPDVQLSRQGDMQTWLQGHQAVAPSETSTSSGGKPSLEWHLDSPDYSRFSTVFKPKANYRSLLFEVSELYKFLGERDFTHKSLLPVSERCPHLRHELRRRGDTFLNDQGNWQAMDTQSYHSLRSNRWIGCYYREYPMGWGWVPGQSNSVPEGIEYTENPPDDFSSEDFWRWVNKATRWNILGGDSNPLANSRAISERHRWSGGGLVPYVDIVDASRQASLLFSLSLIQHEVEGQRLITHSHAETFFERPTYRHDRRRETANFWHPYWQVRLVKPGTPVKLGSTTVKLGEQP